MERRRVKRIKDFPQSCRIPAEQGDSEVWNTNLLRVSYRPEKTNVLATLGLAVGAVLLFGPVNPRQEVSFTSEWVTRGALRPHEISRKDPRTAEIEQTLFGGFLTYKAYKFEVIALGSPETYHGGFVHGPGHHASAVAAFSLADSGKPLVLLKSGDLRLSRFVRGEPYLLDGFVAGRLDKSGLSSSQIATEELSEEIGAEVVDNSLRALGSELTPTMPLESTECDSYFTAVVRTVGAAQGDGGKMEVPEMIGAKTLSPREAWELFEEGKVCDAGRAQTLYGRAFDSMGYLRSHDVYVADFPELLERFDSLGTGEVWDPREFDASKVAAKFRGSDRLSEGLINTALVTDERKISLDSGEMVEAKVRHAVEKSGKITPVGPEFSSEYLKLPYDRLKLAEYYVDEETGPMVRLFTQVRAPLEFAPGGPRVFRRDVTDTAIERDLDFPGSMEKTVELGEPTSASAGQSDLYYRFGASLVEKPEKPTGEGYVTLAEAIRECREGQADAQTEALLMRLADHLRWNPNLGMSWESIDKMLGR